MRVKLGIPEMLGSGPLARRLAALTGARLVLLCASLVLVGAFYLRGKFGLNSFTLRVALESFAVSFGLAGIYAVLLRRGRNMERLAEAQLIVDQLTWTIVVYLTGGASSGATSFYGVSCLVGASLMGLRGAALAALAGAASYGTLVFSLQLRILSPPPDQPPSIYRLSPDELAFYLLVNLLVLIVVALLAGTLADRLRWTGGELVAATERADQAERMAGLGRLAAGLAHEIRNPLGSIAGSIQLLRKAAGLSDEDQRLCDIIQRETSRLNDLVTDMVDLSKPKKPIFGRIDVARVAREVVALAAKSGRAVSDVDVSYSGVEFAEITADGAQLRQLIWNLVRNAVQASRPGEAVDVAVELSDGRAWLRVSDHGVGIDEAAKERLFDAFFTTRSQGTGMGLAVVKRIADEHGFSILVESSRGQGATFSVDLGTTRPSLESAPNLGRVAP
ncbi:MAG TPA: ATP-binding protein [Polyangiaceae bacterium]|jgi:two-component system sensor histidine kinase HydH|nr:ATP-binding protein [Polyangiaceae bacterium]